MAFISPWLSNRMFRGMVPAVILEIIMGFIIGPQVLNWAVITPTIDFLAGFGFSYLMFLSGIELDFDLILARTGSQAKPPWLRGGMFFLVTCLITTGITIGLYLTGIIHNVFLVALILSSTSVGIVTPALKEKGWLGDPFGQEMLLYALISDVLTLILFSGYIAIHTTANKKPAAVIGPLNNPNIVAQRGTFTVFPKVKEITPLNFFPDSADYLVKITIAADRVSYIKEQLTHYGITRLALFPEITEVANEIRLQVEREGQLTPSMATEQSPPEQASNSTAVGQPSRQIDQWLTDTLSLMRSLLLNFSRPNKGQNPLQ